MPRLDAHRPDDHHHLYLPGDTAVHRLAPEAKLVAHIAFVVAVALTPREAVAVFAVDALSLVVVVTVARVPVRALVRRLAVIVPFVIFAVTVPLLGGGERVDVAGLAVSIQGLWAGWNIVVKALLGATASIVLSATTPIPDIIGGLGRLRVPSTVVAIVSFMFRYLDIVGDQLKRMRTAMVARAHDPRWLWQARPMAASAGALFVRSYERGERIHDAMLARGFTGVMPDLEQRRASSREWVVAGVLPVVATTGLAAALAW